MLENKYDCDDPRWVTYESIQTGAFGFLISSVLQVAPESQHVLGWMTQSGSLNSRIVRTCCCWLDAQEWEFKFETGVQAVEVGDGEASYFSGLSTQVDISDWQGALRRILLQNHFQPNCVVSSVKGDCCRWFLSVEGWIVLVLWKEREWSENKVAK